MPNIQQSGFFWKHLLFTAVNEGWGRGGRAGEGEQWYINMIWVDESAELLSAYVESRMALWENCAIYILFFNKNKHSNATKVFTTYD